MPGNWCGEFVAIKKKRGEDDKYYMYPGGEERWFITLKLKCPVIFYLLCKRQVMNVCNIVLTYLKDWGAEWDLPQLLLNNSFPSTLEI